MRYLLTGGGTGGHVYPALAIADELLRTQQDAQFLYVGMRDKLEAWIVPARGYPIRFVRARAFPRSASLAAALGFAMELSLGILQAIFILLRFRPQIIIGTGGYGSAPILFAHAALAKVGLSRARVFVYEPNAYPGLLNQAVGRIAHRIGVGFERAARWFDMKRVAVVGYPVRRELTQVGREQARQVLDIPAARKVLLVFGGSSGSRVINRALVAALPRLRRHPQIMVLHITGRQAGSGYDAVADTEACLECVGIRGDTSSWYRRYDYLDDIQHAYGAADLVVCRGGAGTLTEVALCGLPALIVPLPTAAEDHQAINARELERLGAAQVLYQRARWEQGEVVGGVDQEELAARVLALLDDDLGRQRMAAAARAVPTRDSLELIRRELQSLAGGQRPPPLDLRFPDSGRAVPEDPNALLRHVRQLVDPDAAAVAAPDLAYLRYQADRLLVSRAWYEIPLGRRNVGVKLVGLLHYQEHLALLLNMLLDRTPVSWVQRLAGGDYRHGGLLRRNVIQLGLVPLGLATDQVRAGLLRALNSDPYFEVRAAAAAALGTLCRPAADIQQALIAALEDGSAPVVVQALRALGELATSAAVLPHLQRFFLAAHWPFRLEVVRALTRLLERGVLRRQEVAGQVQRILATSSFFHPDFPLNEQLRKLTEYMQEQVDGEGR